MSHSFVIAEVVDGISDLFEEVKHLCEGVRRETPEEILLLNKSRWAAKLRALLEEYGIMDTVFVSSDRHCMTPSDPESNFADEWHMDPLNDDLYGNYAHPIVGGAFTMLMYTRKDATIAGGNLQIARDRSGIPYHPLVPRNIEIKDSINFHVCCDMIVFMSEDQLHRVTPLTGGGVRVCYNITAMSPTISTGSVFS